MVPRRLKSFLLIRALHDFLYNESTMHINAEIRARAAAAAVKRAAPIAAEAKRAVAMTTSICRCIYRARCSIPIRIEYSTVISPGGYSRTPGVILTGHLERSFGLHTGTTIARLVYGKIRGIIND